MLYRRLTLTFVVAFALPLGVTRADSNTADQNLAEIHEQIRAEVESLTREKSEEGKRTDPDRIIAVFDAHLSDYRDPKTWKDLDGDELAELYRATHDTIFYTHDPSLTQMLAALSRGIESRESSVDPMDEHPFHDNHLQTTYQALIQARLLDEADSFSEEFDEQVTAAEKKLDRELLEQTRDKEGTTILDIREQDGIPLLKPRNIDVKQGQWMIVSSNPGCQFSRHAMEYIEESPELAEALPENTLWLASQRYLAEAQPLAEWSREAQATELAMTDYDADWPLEFALNVTPRFYFLDEGEIVHSFPGWQGDYQAEDLMEGIEALSER